MECVVHLRQGDQSEDQPSAPWIRARVPAYHSPRINQVSMRQEPIIPLGNGLGTLETALVLAQHACALQWDSRRVRYWKPFLELYVRKGQVLLCSALQDPMHGQSFLPMCATRPGKPWHGPASMLPLESRSPRVHPFGQAAVPEHRGRTTEARPLPLGLFLVGSLRRTGLALKVHPY